MRRTGMKHYNRLMVFPILAVLVLSGCGKKEASQENTPSLAREVSEATLPAVPATAETPVTGTKKWGDAPDFTLPLVGGGELTLSEAAGKVIILDFWATWCGPCRMEIPGFIELYGKYKDRGLMIIGVSLDRGGASDVAPYAEEAGINYPLVLGDRSIANLYGGIRGIPTTFIIDRNGNRRETLIGYHDKDVFEKYVTKLLAE